MTSVVNSMVSAASDFKSKRAAAKLSAIIQAQYLLDELKTISSAQDKKKKQIIISAFTQATLEIF